MYGLTQMRRRCFFSFDFVINSVLGYFSSEHLKATITARSIVNLMLNPYMESFHEMIIASDI